MGVERLTTSMEKSRCVLKSGSGGGDDECTKENAMEFWFEEVGSRHDPGLRGVGVFSKSRCVLNSGGGGGGGEMEFWFEEAGSHDPGSHELVNRCVFFSLLVLN